MVIKIDDVTLWKIVTGAISDTEVKPFRVDPSTHTMQTIDYVHHEIHGGNAYSVVDVVDLAGSNVRDLQITTPNTTKWAHFFFSIKTESETMWYLYENADIIVTGTSVIPRNSNRNSSNFSGLLLREIDNTSLANANADTSVTGSTLLHSGISGAGKDAGEFTHAEEDILKQDETYCIRFVASTAGYVNYHLSWYEHTNKN